MKKGVCAAIALVLLITVFPFRAMAEPEEKWITVPFFSAGMWEMKWEFPYSDRYFLEPSEEFSRDIAKASLGLTVSAFREGGTSTVPNQYEVYLKEAGFSDIHAFGYDQPTSPHTLAGVIASRKIGDFTLIAASPCGQGYQKEWGGNLNLGVGERHAGFEEAAQIMEKEILSYIEEHDLTGRLKLWISSFSRGSAVSNLTAADMIESGRFEDVYAYLYAVPRTTTNEIMYPSIFNICGSYDPVTQIPLQSWGYYRYGRDLYLPAAATDIDYDAVAVMHVSEVTEKVAGDHLRFNPEWNYQIHLILEFIGEMFPDNAAYYEKMQEKVMSIWTEADPDQLFQILSSVFASLDDLDRRQEFSREVFLDYLLYLFDIRVQDPRGSYEQRDLAWASDQGLAANLMREHMPYIYLSWIFSDLSDEELFGGSNSTQRFAVLGDVDIEIWQGDVFLNGMDRYGKPIIRLESMYPMETFEDYQSVYVQRSGITTMAFIPVHDSFQVRIITKDSTSFTYHDDTCFLSSTYGLSHGYHTVTASPGTYEIDFLEYTDQPGVLNALEGQIISDVYSDTPYSPTMVMQFQMDSESRLTVDVVLSHLTGVGAAVLAFLLGCLAIAIVHKVKKKTHGPYSPWYVIVPHYMLLIMLVWFTIAFTKTLYLFTYARAGCAAASSLVLTLLALRGLIRNRKLTNVLITAVMPAFGVADALIYQQSEIVGKDLGMNILYCVVMLGLAALAAVPMLSGRNKNNRTDDVDR